MTQAVGASEHPGFKSLPYPSGASDRLFPDLPAWTPCIGRNPSAREVEAHFLRIACEEMIDEDDRAAAPSTGGVPAGYIFFAQLIDHDMRFRGRRYPALDLSILYGGGPGESPHLFDQNDPGCLLCDPIEGTQFVDLPRNRQGIAMIADPRNDQNVILAGLHLAFAQAHNTLVQRARSQRFQDPFTAARQTLRWLYQHIVWNDLVARLVDPEIFSASLMLQTSADGRPAWQLGLADILDPAQCLFVPAEFTGAVFRFAHVLVGEGYRTNALRGDDIVPAYDLRHEIGQDLRGGRALTPGDVIQWNWFLEMGEHPPQMSRTIGPTLSRTFAKLPNHGAVDNILAFRNFQRGWRLGLPSGTETAHRLGIAPLQVQQDHDCLWYYVLREAAAPGVDGLRLGRVGSSVICATVAALMKADRAGWLTCRPAWRPEDDSLLKPEDNRDSLDGRWRLPAIIRLAGVPCAAEEFARQVI